MPGLLSCRRSEAGGAGEGGGGSYYRSSILTRGEGVDCPWLSRLFPGNSPPIQERTLTRLKYRKHLKEDLPNGDLSPPLSPECFHTLGWESLPLDQQQLFVLPLFQLLRVSYISFLSFCFSVISCAFYRNVLWFTMVCLLGFGRGLRSSHPASSIPPLYLYLSCLNHTYEVPLARYHSSVSDTILRIDLPIMNVCSVIIVYAII
ncbi:hypothetical protein NE237_028038 [Protea cynaroides]|uniref:Uncharacterized protein n=1 Tax=Protea cynaroides TaxID=273540 RepID=A0A9Q0GQF4_9MAGN|nr:hypothetical protein NE237_028038 [Protea cynaroides]